MSPPAPESKACLQFLLSSLYVLSMGLTSAISGAVSFSTRVRNQNVFNPTGPEGAFEALIFIGMAMIGGFTGGLMIGVFSIVIGKLVNYKVALVISLFSYLIAIIIGMVMGWLVWLLIK